MGAAPGVGVGTTDVNGDGLEKGVCPKDCAKGFGAGGDDGAAGAIVGAGGATGVGAAGGTGGAKGVGAAGAVGGENGAGAA